MRMELSTFPERFIVTMSLPTSSKELSIIMNGTLSSTNDTLDTDASLSQTASEKQPTSTHSQTAKSDKPFHALPPTQTIRRKQGDIQPGKSSNVKGSKFAQAEVDHMLRLIDEFLQLCWEEWDEVLAEH